MLQPATPRDTALHSCTAVCNRSHGWSARDHCSFAARRPPRCCPLVAWAAAAAAAAIRLSALRNRRNRGPISRRTERRTLSHRRTAAQPYTANSDTATLGSRQLPPALGVRCVAVEALVGCECAAATAPAHLRHRETNRNEDNSAATHSQSRVAERTAGRSGRYSSPVAPLVAVRLRAVA